MFIPLKSFIYYLMYKNVHSQIKWFFFSDRLQFKFQKYIHTYSCLGIPNSILPPAITETVTTGALKQPLKPVPEATVTFHIFPRARVVYNLNTSRRALFSLSLSAQYVYTKVPLYRTTAFQKHPKFLQTLARLYNPSSLQFKHTQKIAESKVERERRAGNCRV